jgi:S-DNA-T family DNA segregation ATPase FtsK/SpoIIIE
VTVLEGAESAGTAEENEATGTVEGLEEVTTETTTPAEEAKASPDATVEGLAVTTETTTPAEEATAGTDATIEVVEVTTEATGSADEASAEVEAEAEVEATVDVEPADDPAVGEIEPGAAAGEPPQVTGGSTVDDAVNAEPLEESVAEPDGGEVS